MDTASKNTPSQSPLEALKNLIFNAEETNHDHIASLKDALSTGRYEIQSQLIASKLLREFEPA